MVANEELDIIEHEAKSKLICQGFPLSSISVTRYLNCRYRGTDTAIITTVALDESTRPVSYVKMFVDTYRREYGFELPERDILGFEK